MDRKNADYFAELDMNRNLDRREFVKTSISLGGAAAAGSLSPMPSAAESPNGKLQCAFVGVGGKGETDLAEITGHPKAVAIALCDVDEQKLGKAASKHPAAKTFTDWREMLELPGIDAICVTTPDHMHAPVAVSAMRMGKHIYCQKPLTHSVHEARVMAEVAAEKKLVTQMGLQHHSLKSMKTGVQAIRAGVIGKAKSVYAWTDRPIWPQGMRRRSVEKPSVKHLHWDLWLGVAPQRPYGDGYHPFNWRGWSDFGTGAMGDMGCHTLDPAMTALELGPATQITSNGVKPNGQSFPTNSVIYYTITGSEWTVEKTIPLVWYDGGNKPTAKEIGFADDWNMPANGCAVVGTKGSIFISFDQLPTVAPKQVEMEVAKDVNHYHEWIDACHGTGKTSTPIDTYSGPLTETVLLGNVALHFPGVRLEWDSKAFEFKNLPIANKYLKRNYRDGWSVEGLG